MQKKNQLAIFILLLIMIILASQMNFLGCVGSKPTELTPEQKAALQDSLREEHKRKMQLYWSFGYEPYKQGDYVKAKRYFKRVAEQDTMGVYGRILYQYLGDAYLHLNIPDSAEWAYNMGLERMPDNPYFYRVLGYIYRAGNRVDEAIDMYSKLTELEPDSANHYQALGELYVNVAETDMAIEAYQNSVRLDPTNLRAQEVLSNLLSQTGDIDQVIDTQKTLVNNEPENMRYRFDLAQTYHRAGQFENAVEQLQFVIEKEPQNILAGELLGDSYQQLERYGRAVEVYQTILRNQPDDKKNMCNLAICYNFLGRYVTARREVRKVLRMDSEYGLAYLTLGMIYETSADKCVERAGGKITYSDKLVYKMAYDEFMKARRDLMWKSEAERRIRYVEPMIPTREDEFMHKDQVSPTGECYEWIG